MAKSKDPTKELKNPPKGKAQPIENKKVVKAKTKPKKSKATTKKVEKAPAVAAPDQVGQCLETSEKVLDLAAAFASLPIKQQIFIEEYLVDTNATQAAIRAGYSKHSAAALGPRVRNIPAVAAIIDARLQDRFERTRMTTDRLLSEYEHMAEADFNELVEFRRVNCRHCWGIGFQYQRNIVEMESARKEHERQMFDQTLKGTPAEQIAPFDEGGGIGFLPNKDPNPECPVCAGEGHGEVFFKDTRNLSRRARAIYAGAEIGKDGIKMKGYSKEKAMEIIAKSLKLFSDAPELNFNVLAPAELSAVYEQGLSKAKAKDESVIGRSKRMAGADKAG